MFDILNKALTFDPHLTEGSVIAIEIESTETSYAIDHIKSLLPIGMELQTYLPCILTMNIKVQSQYIAINLMHTKPDSGIFPILKSYAKQNRKIIFILFRPHRIAVLNQLHTGNVQNSYYWLA